MVIEDYLLGHKSPSGRPNIKKELKRIRTNPLRELLTLLDKEDVKIVSDDFSQYWESYSFYYLSFERYLPSMSIAARYSKGPYWIRRSGGKYTESEQALADKYNAIKHFLAFDTNNCLLYARIPLDRTVALSRYVLNERQLPSFTSFNSHKKFFGKLHSKYGDHESYAEYFRTNTNWFDMPLKYVRDKILVHASPKHLKFLGYPNGGYHLDMIVELPDTSTGNVSFARTKHIRVNALQLSYDIESFLIWFNNYAVCKLRNSEHVAPLGPQKADAFRAR